MAENDTLLTLARTQREIIRRQIALERRLGSTPADLADIQGLGTENEKLITSLEDQQPKSANGPNAPTVTAPAGTTTMPRQNTPPV